MASPDFLSPDNSSPTKPSSILPDQLMWTDADFVIWFNPFQSQLPLMMYNWPTFVPDQPSSSNSTDQNIEFI